MRIASSSPTLTRRRLLWTAICAATTALLGACGREPQGAVAASSPTPAPTRIIAVPTIPTAPVNPGAADFVWVRGITPAGTRPGGVAVDSHGDVYVTVRAYPHVRKFDLNGNPLLAWGNGPGGGDGEFVVRIAPENVYGIAVGVGDVVFVTDLNNRVQVFDPTGKFMGAWGTQGSGDGQFLRVGAIATDTQGNVYVTDTARQRIQKFDQHGQFLLGWGGPGTNNGQFDQPAGIAVDARGQVYVTDSGNHRVQVFDTTGMFLMQWGGHGAGDGEFNSPWLPAVDAAGNLYVGDNGNDRVQVFDGSGQFLGKWGGHGAGNGQFTYTGGVALDGRGDVYVVDVIGERLEKFRLR